MDSVQTGAAALSSSLATPFPELCTETCTQTIVRSHHMVDAGCSELTRMSFYLHFMTHGCKIVQRGKLYADNASRKRHAHTHLSTITT